MVIVRMASNLQTFSWNGTDAQLWKFVDAEMENIIFSSKVGHGD